MNIDGDKINGGIVIDYPVEDLEDCDTLSDKVYNILLYKIDRNKYAYISGSLKIVEWRIYIFFLREMLVTATDDMILLGSDGKPEH